MNSIISIVNHIPQENLPVVLIVTVLSLIVILVALIIILIWRIKQVSELKASHSKLMRSFGELDEQAKLIVKTDLELNKAQEELDKRLHSLEALQKTSRLISTTLDEEEIFHRLDQPLMTDLGFEKYLILIFDEKNKLQCRIHSGYTKEATQYILSNLENDTSLNEALKQGHTFSSANAPKQRKEKIAQLFNVEHFVLSAILTQNGIIGIVFVGNRSDASAVTQGDEELLSILANQIGQSVENARLFEQVYRSSQMLESKVQERTKQLASALEEVKKISKTKSEFISAVSHELRTPLTSIKGYASILMTGKVGELPEQVKERLEKVNKHSDNLVKLINDLLDISRIESGRVEMKFVKCSMASLIENVRDLLTPQIKEKNLQLETNIASNTPEIYIDRDQIERVFINLLGNAIKFTPEGGTITIKVYLDSQQLKVEISDTGIGIAEEDLGKLFNEFYRVDNVINQNVKGSGLGLTLAKGIVEAHQGRIWVTSKLKKGTTFHFTLPLERQKVAIDQNVEY